MIDDPKVLIVGAGPTGLALALFLAKSGVRSRIIDKNAGPGTSSRALGVQARTLEFYRQIGIADDVVKQGIQLESLFLRRRGRVAARVDIGQFGAGISPYPFVLSFPQDEHETLLIAHLARAGVSIEWNTTLTELHESEKTVQVGLRRRDGSLETMAAMYVCGCDGARSKVRQQLALRFEGGTYDKTYFVADVIATGASTQRGSFSLCLGLQGVLLVMPVRDRGSYRLIGVVPKGLPTKDAITFEDLRPFVERQAAITIAQVNWFSTYHAHHRVADHLGRARVFLAGDAGHIHSPVGGQGMNTGIGDAANLAWKMAAVLTGRAHESMLETYSTERIAFARLLVATTDRAFKLMVGTGVGAKLFRSLVLPIVAPLAIRLPPIRAAIFRVVSQARVQYRNSKLSSGMANGLHGGDRLPWVAKLLIDDNYSPLRTFDWQLHVYGVATLALQEEARAVQLPLHEFAWLPDMSKLKLQENAMYLIRPDGYCAYIDENQNVVSLREFIDRFALQFDRR